LNQSDIAGEKAISRKANTIDLSGRWNGILRIITIASIPGGQSTGIR